MTGDKTKSHNASDKRLSFRQVVGSAFAAAIGIQTSANRERDFAQGKPLHFILVGVIFVAMFILIILLVVRTVLAAG